MGRKVYPDLHTFLKESGTSSMDLADEMGVSFPYMEQLRWRERTPKLPLALRLMERCHIPIESLLRPEERAAFDAAERKRATPRNDERSKR